MTCREFIDLLVDYSANELESDARRLCDEHVEACRQCANFLESYECTQQLGRRVYQFDDESRVELPEEFVQTLLAVAAPRPPA